MKLIERIASFDIFFRPLIYHFPELIISRIYSPSRKIFIKYLTNQKNIVPIKIPEKYKRTLWGIEFNSPIINAAGMFKNGEGYKQIALQGAGAYLAGTTTSNPRLGNIKKGIKHPFLPIPKSLTAINWMGLPNKGHKAIAEEISKIDKIKGCPIGISLGLDPELSQNDAVKGLLEGLFLYEKANVDFIEINESCPNVEHIHGEIDKNGLDVELVKRLKIISIEFNNKRKRNLPVILKFSNDTELELVEPLIRLSIDLDFDGINFGNTSTQYEYCKKFIKENELSKYELFIKIYGGGVSGRPLKELSYELCKQATEIISKMELKTEFHIIRTGGIENYSDIEASDNINVSLNQWFSGYFEEFARTGNNCYKEMFNN